MEQRRNAKVVGGGGTGDPRENTPASGIVQHHSYTRKHWRRSLVPLPGSSNSLPSSALAFIYAFVEGGAAIACPLTAAYADEYWELMSFNVCKYQAGHARWVQMCSVVRSALEGFVLGGNRVGTHVTIPSHPSTLIIASTSTSSDLTTWWAELTQYITSAYLLAIVRDLQYAAQSIPARNSSDLTTWWAELTQYLTSAYLLAIVRDLQYAAQSIPARKSKLVRITAPFWAFVPNKKYQNHHSIGATVAERLACSPSTSAIWVRSPAGFSQVGIIQDYAVARRVFSGISRFPGLSFRCCAILASITLIGSQDLDMVAGLDVSLIAISLEMQPETNEILMRRLKILTRLTWDSNTELLVLQARMPLNYITEVYLCAEFGGNSLVGYRDTAQSFRFLEQRRNARTGETGDPLENPPTSGIVRHDSHLRKSGSDPASGIEPLYRNETPRRFIHRGRTHSLIGCARLWNEPCVRLATASSGRRPIGWAAGWQGGYRRGKLAVSGSPWFNRTGCGQNLDW
ncbi:hypothetical protein PR048_022715 [Dryococelus australis]|uniref:Uncharacterized protein n=1 Tax=Dryococelus australis TaxID=614101 RepID=A0ABQ9GS16_9NEOP|nr:hypothetical protein PR048_022715 [Dryococelus australis]